MRRLNEKRRKSFAEHASPESIRAAPEAEQQVATGTWPTASTTNDQKGSTA